MPILNGAQHVVAFAALHLGRDPARGRSWRYSWPILGLGAAVTLLAAYLHSRATLPPGVAGYATSLNMIGFVQTELRETVSGIPNIYFLSGAQGLLGITRTSWLLLVGAVAQIGRCPFFHDTPQTLLRASMARAASLISACELVVEPTSTRRLSRVIANRSHVHAFCSRSKLGHQDFLAETGICCRWGSCLRSEIDLEILAPTPVTTMPDRLSRRRSNCAPRSAYGERRRVGCGLEALDTAIEARAYF